MGNQVYANGREIACKAGGNQVIAAFPDVCLSPPSPPAGPVPIPYPVSSSSADTSGGSKTVTISGQEVMLKDQSYYTKCTGDEAATKSLGQGAVNHALSGKVYFVSWSMDVRFEGENVVRHLDMTTSNHASPMPNEAASIPGFEEMDPSVKRKCEKVYDKYQLHDHEHSPCNYTETGKQSHHPAMNACFSVKGDRSKPYGNLKYDTGDAPAICLETRGDSDTPHKKINGAQLDWAADLEGPPKLSEVRAAGKEHLKKGGLTESEAECIMKVVDAYMEKKGITEKSVLRAP